MKKATYFFLIVFFVFLITPTLVSVVKKSKDTFSFYSISDEELTQKEIKAVFCLGVFSKINFKAKQKLSIIRSENLSKHNPISSKIFIPPPELT